MEGIIVKKWDSLQECKSVLGMEIIYTQGDLFDKLIKEYYFDKWVENIKNKGLDSETVESSYSYEALKQLKQLKESIKGAKPKITIKIELESYG